MGHVVHEATFSYFLASLALGCLIHTWSALSVLLHKKKKIRMEYERDVKWRKRKEAADSENLAFYQVNKIRFFNLPCNKKFLNRVANMKTSLYKWGFKICKYNSNKVLYLFLVCVFWGGNSRTNIACMCTVVNASEPVVEVCHLTGDERHKFKESLISFPDSFYSA